MNDKKTCICIKKISDFNLGEIYIYSINPYNYYHVRDGDNIVRIYKAYDELFEFCRELGFKKYFLDLQEHRNNLIKDILDD